MSTLTKKIADDIGFKKIGETKHGVRFYGAISEEQLDIFTKTVMEKCIEQIQGLSNNSGDEWDNALGSARDSLLELINEQQVKSSYNEKKLKP